MHFDDFKALCNAACRAKPKYEEHQLQCSCVQWFRLAYPHYAHCLFAVPNGAKRDKIIGKRLREEGVLAGVADLILLKSNSAHGALLIEMKTPKGRLSDVQKLWSKKIMANGYKYIVCRSFDEFRQSVEDYLKLV